MKLLIFNLFLLIPILGFSQSSDANILTNDSLKYVEIMRLVDITQDKRDSVNIILVELKDSISKYPQSRSSLIKDVLDNESILFDIENELARNKAQKNLLEQQFVFNQIDKHNETQSQKIAGQSLFTIPAIKDNMLAGEINLLRKESKMDSLYRANISSIDSIYNKLVVVDTLLRRVGVGRQEADSLFSVADSLMQVSTNIESGFMSVWQEIYDTKVYAYSKIIEKIEVAPDKYELLSEDARSMRVKLSDECIDVFAPNIYAYTFQKSLSRKYELLALDKLNAIKVIDSLKSADNSIKLPIFNKKIITLPDYQYPQYEEFGIYKAFVTKDEDVKDIVVPTVGAIYMTRVVTLSKPLSPSSTVRKLTPVYAFVNNKNMTEYYTGVYRTVEEAREQIKRLTPLGYKPSITTFREGAKVMPDGSLYPVDASKHLYSLEFDSMNDELKLQLETLAEDKQVVFVDGVYSLGVFSNYNDMLEVKDKLEVPVRVVKIEKNF